MSASPALCITTSCHSDSLYSRLCFPETQLEISETRNYSFAVFDVFSRASLPLVCQNGEEGCSLQNVELLAILWETEGFH